MKRKALHDLVTDPSLSPDALRIVLYVHSLGPGPHPVSTQILESLVQTRTNRVRQRAMNLAVGSGWLLRKPGGWGSTSIMEFTERAESTPSVDPNQASLDLASTMPDDAASALSGGKLDSGARPDSAESTLSLSPDSAESTPSEALTVLDQHAQRTRARVELGVVGDGSSSTKAREKQPLDGEVEIELRGETWKGMRGALRDYLTDRVPPDSQLYYMMTVQTWLQGAPSAPKGLLQLPVKRQHLLVASALNELLQMPAAEEPHQFRSARGRSGETHVLRTKIEYLIRRGPSDGQRTGKHGRRTEGGSSPGSSIGSNFTGYPEDDAGTVPD